MNRRSITNFLNGPFFPLRLRLTPLERILKVSLSFYSRSGHTETLANTLAKLTGAETIRIESTSPIRQIMTQQSNALKLSVRQTLFRLFIRLKKI